MHQVFHLDPNNQLGKIAYSVARRGQDAVGTSDICSEFGFPYKMIHNGMSVATNMILLNHMLLVVNWDIFQHVIDLIMSCCPKRHVTHI